MWVGGGAGYAINGQRSSSTDILLDGGQNVDLFTSGVGQSIPLDSVNEFSVLTNNFGAEYGRAGGGVVNVVTKSGTNAFHGSAYEYNRVAALSSNTSRMMPPAPRRAGSPAISSGLPSAAPLSRNTGSSLATPSGSGCAAIRRFNSTSLTPGSIASTGLATQRYFNAYGKLAPGVTLGAPFPCVTGSPLNCDQATFLVGADAGGGLPQNTWQEVARVDYNISDKPTMFGRYAAYHETDFDGTVNNSPYAGYNTGQKNFDQNVTYDITHVFSPNVVNTFKFIYNRINGPVQPLGANPASPTLYTTTAVPSLPENGLQLVFPGYVETTPGSGIPFGGPQNVYQFVDDISWTKGKHQFKFGGEYIQLRDNRVFGAYENAVEALGSALTCKAGTEFPAGNCYSAIHQLQTGNVYSFQNAIYPQGKFPCVNNINTGRPIVTPDCTLQLPVGPPAFGRNYRYNDGAVYGQDTWKLTPRLTLNLGLRWEYYGVQHNANQALDSNFVFGPGGNPYDAIRNGVVKLASQGGVFWHPDCNNFGPRVGFAYDVFGDGTTSLRGGYGISYERNFGNVTFNAIQNPPNYGVISLISNQDVPINQPVYTDNVGPLQGTGTKALPQVSQRAINQNIRTAYTQAWNFGVQRQVAKNSVLAVTYAGAHAVKEYDIANVNNRTAGMMGMAPAACTWAMLVWPTAST